MGKNVAINIILTRINSADTDTLHIGNDNPVATTAFATENNNSAATNDFVTGNLQPDGNDKGGYTGNPEMQLLIANRYSNAVPINGPSDGLPKYHVNTTALHFLQTLAVENSLLNQRILVLLILRE
jgi:hypothetical protein